jgi:hypothetical protein
VLRSASSRCVTILARETLTSSEKVDSSFPRVEQVFELPPQSGQARGIAVEGKLTGDRSLRLGDIVHQPAERGILFIERELLDDHVDFRLDVFAQVAVVAGELRDQPA